MDKYTEIQVPEIQGFAFENYCDDGLPFNYNSYLAVLVETSNLNETGGRIFYINKDSNEYVIKNINEMAFRVNFDVRLDKSVDIVDSFVYCDVDNNILDDGERLFLSANSITVFDMDNHMEDSVEALIKGAIKDHKEILEDSLTTLINDKRDEQELFKESRMRL